VTHDKTVHLLDLSVGKFVNVSMAVRALQVAVWTLKIQVFRHIEKPEGFFLVLLLANITEPPVFMAKETVFFIDGLNFSGKAAHKKKQCRQYVS
jgi:hypothetical protein